MSEPEFTYKIVQAPVWSSFRYKVYVFRNGREVGDTFVSTMWGARWAARKMKRKCVARALQLVVEEGELRG